MQGQDSHSLRSPGEAGGGGRTGRQRSWPSTLACLAGAFTALQCWLSMTKCWELLPGEAASGGGLTSQTRTPRPSIVGGHLRVF